MFNLIIKFAMFQAEQAKKRTLRGYDKTALLLKSSGTPSYKAFSKAQGKIDRANKDFDRYMDLYYWACNKKCKYAQNPEISDINGCVVENDDIDWEGDDLPF